MLLKPSRFAKLPSYDRVIVDRFGQRGIFWTAEYDSVKRHAFGIARRRVLYALADDHAELGADARLIFATNMGLTVEEIATAADFVEVTQRVTRNNAKIGSNFILQLPHDVPQDTRETIMRRVGHEVFGQHQLPYVGCLHRPDAAGDERNYHAHFWSSLRPLERTGPYSWQISDDYRSDLSGADYHRYVRRVVADIMTDEMRKAGIGRTYTHRSNAERGLINRPQIKLGAAKTRQVREGVKVSANERNAEKIAEAATFEKVIALNQASSRLDEADVRTNDVRERAEFLKPTVSVEIRKGPSHNLAPAPLLNVPSFASLSWEAAVNPVSLPSPVHNFRRNLQISPASLPKVAFSRSPKNVAPVSIGELQVPVHGPNISSISRPMVVLPPERGLLASPLGSVSVSTDAPRFASSTTYSLLPAPHLTGGLVPGRPRSEESWDEKMERVAEDITLIAQEQLRPLVLALSDVCCEREELEALPAELRARLPENLQGLYDIAKQVHAQYLIAETAAEKGKRLFRPFHELRFIDNPSEERLNRVAFDVNEWRPDYMKTSQAKEHDLWARAMRVKALGLAEASLETPHAEMAPSPANRDDQLAGQRTFTPPEPSIIVANQGDHSQEAPSSSETSRRVHAEQPDDLGSKFSSSAAADGLQISNVENVEKSPEPPINKTEEEGLGQGGHAVAEQKVSSWLEALQHGRPADHLALAVIQDGNANGYARATLLSSQWEDLQKASERQRAWLIAAQYHGMGR